MDIVLQDNETMQDINEHLKLISRKDGLTFGSDAYLLAAFVRPRAGKKAVDLGSGTGVMPLLLLAKSKCETVYAVEIQPDFVDLIGRNASLNGFASQLIPVSADIRELTEDQIEGTADYVISNPPYLKTHAGNSNDSSAKNIARHEVMGGIDDFAKAAGRVLKSGGLAYFVYRPDRMIDLLASLRVNHLEPKRMMFVCANPDSEPSMVLVEAQKDANAGLRILPNLNIYKEGSEKHAFTELYQKIYENCQIPDALLKI